MEKTLYLHVGHGKTGSSFIQSVLWLNRAVLLERGIYYPVEQSNKTAQGSITSGNGYQMATNFSKFAAAVKSDKIISQFPTSKVNALCFSSEFLFESFTDQNFQTALNAFCSKLGVANVEVLLFIRNPIDHIASTYQQTIKRRGGVRRVTEMPFTQYNIPTQVNSFISALNSALSCKVNLSVFNYSNHKSEIHEILSAWLGCEASELEQPAQSRVNRSLTLGELELQRLFNQKLGGSAKFIADRLCESVPSVEKSKVLPSVQKQQEIVNRLMDSIDSVNALIPESEHYTVDIQPPGDTGECSYTFNQEQLQAIVNALTDNMKLNS